MALLWLWCRPPATAPRRPLAWEPSYATGADLEKAKRPKKKKKNLYRIRLRILSKLIHAQTFVTMGGTKSVLSKCSLRLYCSHENNVNCDMVIALLCTRGAVITKEQWQVAPFTGPGLDLAQEDPSA